MDIKKFEQKFSNFSTSNESILINKNLNEKYWNTL